MKPIFVLCEGPHDTAFFGLLLRAAGINRFEALLGDYEPKALRDFLINRYRQRDVEGGHSRSSGSIVLEAPPILESVYALADPPRLLLFYRCNGEHDDAVGAFLKDLVALTLPGAQDVGLTSFGVLFVRDADDVGPESKVASLKEKFAEILRPVLPGIDELSANDPRKLVKDGEMSAGACILCGAQKSVGTLEDIVWPMLHALIPKQLGEADNYIQTFGIAGTRIAHGNNTAAKRKKAALTIAGQTDAPGASLAVVLRDMKALTDEVVRSDSVCQIFTNILTEM